MIRFKLKNFDQIQPVGQAPDLYLSWFWLTDGDLWLKFGNETIYEYTKEALSHFGGKSTPYNDYYLVRFIEDFTELFEAISESVPERFYNLTGDLNSFFTDAKNWVATHETDDEDYSGFYFEEYDKLISWAYQRTFDSGHLIGGPHLSFFRSNNKIRIVWETEHQLENGISIWMARNGSHEMEFADFIEKVKGFGLRFFNAMDKQVELAVEKEWGAIKLDKSGLLAEHTERRADFYSRLTLLEQASIEKTNWTAIEQLYERMRMEI